MVFALMQLLSSLYWKVQYIFGPAGVATSA